MRDKNLKYLVICESPGKVKHLQEYIKKAGYTNVHVMASVGHISEIRNGGSYYNTGIEPTKDFEMDLAISADKKDVVNKLLEQVKWSDHVVLASDGDNEGAQISWSLVKFLKLKKGTYSRMITHEITPTAVAKAFENPVEMDTLNATAAQARMCLDKLCGYRLSPIAKTYIGARSVGRTQSAGLKIIVDRENEIKNFKPETYFDLYLSFKKNKTDFKAKYVGSDTSGQIDKIKTKAEIDSIIKLCNKNYIIEGIDKKERQEAPKPPFMTSSFQQEVASKLSLSVKDAMSCAQKLYEQGYCNYLRTDDDTMAPEFVETLKAYINKNYNKCFVQPRISKKSGNEQEGHECFRITNPSMTPELFAKTEPNTLLQKVYKIIWQRTIAACMPNAIYSDTGYLINNNGQKFLLSSKELIKEGYKAVYSYKDDDDEETEVVKESFSKNEVLENTKLDSQTKTTRAPARYSEASLIAALKRMEIGRPSTFATIVETVLSPSRGYATKDGKSIVPTEKGMQLSAFLDRSFSNIINLEYTRQMEESLDKIANGKLTKSEFLTEFYNDLESTIKNNPELKAAQTIDKICPECGKPLLIRRSKYGTSFLACSGYPQCKHTESLK